MGYFKIVFKRGNGEVIHTVYNEFNGDFNLKSYANFFLRANEEVECIEFHCAEFKEHTVFER